MGAHQNHLPEKRVREGKREMTEGGENVKSEGGEAENQGGKPPPPVQMLGVLICSISTITSPASSLIIISVIFTYTAKRRTTPFTLA